MTPVIVTEPVPLRIVPVRVPPRVPDPDVRVRVTRVSDVTDDALWSASCACTVTEKEAPAAGLTGVIAEMDSSVAVELPTA